MRFVGASISKLVGACVIAAASATAQAAPCSGELANCGFEDPLSAGNWTLGGTSSVAQNPFRSGGNSLRGAGDDGVGSATQSVFGSSIGFDLEFWLRFDGTATESLLSLVSVVAGANTLSITMGDTTDDWTRFTGFTGPTADPWDLVFNFTDPAGGVAIFMDDVTLSERSANNVPEPGSLLLVGVAMAAGAALRRRSRTGA